MNVPLHSADVPDSESVIDLDPTSRERRVARRRPGVRPLYDVYYSDARRKVKRPQNWTTDPTTGKPKPKTRKRYEVRWIDNDGRQRSERFEDKRDAIARHDALAHDFVSGSHIPRERSRTLVSDVAETFASTVVAAKPPTTRQSYGSIVDRFVDRFGKREIGSLVPSDIAGWVGELATQTKPRPLSLASRRKYVAVVRKMLDTAVGDGLIAKNPAVGVDLGRERAQTTTTRSIDRREIPTAAELDRVLAKIDNPTVRDMLRFMSLTGLRVGEACELRVLDVYGNGAMRLTDSGPEITISRAVTEATDEHRSRVVGPPKSGRERTIPLGNSAFAMVHARVRKSGAPIDKRNPDALVFPNRNGTQFYGSNVNDPILIKACEAAKVRRFTTHAMRHFFATDALHRGVPLPTVSDWLGHADVSVTAKVYAHVLRSSHHEAAKLLP
ncbi:MAG: site-specific integrase [Actinomycetota bacterium]|nr:site-specific integrase [Actinomycetota bacterium]